MKAILKYLGISTSDYYEQEYIMLDRISKYYLTQSGHLIDRNSKMPVKTTGSQKDIMAEEFINKVAEKINSEMKGHYKRDKELAYSGRKEGFFPEVEFDFLDHALKYWEYVEGGEEIEVGVPGSLRGAQHITLNLESFRRFLTEYMLPWCDYNNERLKSQRVNLTPVKEMIYSFLAGVNN